jgi:ferric-dicitrate binding protein FerR (iron transport regulator)
MSPHRASSADRDAALQGLGRLARTEISGDATPEQASDARRRFRQGLARETAPRPRAAWWVGGSLGAAAVVAVAFFGFRSLTSAPLSFEVDSAAVANHDYLLVPSTAPSANVRFSDGSSLTLEPGTRGRIAALHADGAAISLESGRASVRVVHRPKTHWSVDAGPFAITVTGTAFDVGWSGADELFEVALRSGSITVRGPLAAAGIQLSAGERLVVNLKANQLRVEQLAAANATSPEPAPQSSGPAAIADDIAPRRADAPAREPKVSWAKRVAAGDFDGVLSEAQQGGLEASMVRSALPDLVALADAARYRGRFDVARRALTAQRERFPSSTAARTAAFLLGRLAEDEPEAAVAWYDRYLREAPSGEFASEALGRKLVAVQRASGSEAARPIAQEYLRRFPRGTYAEKARELARQ